MLNSFGAGRPVADDPGWLLTHTGSAVGVLKGVAVLPHVGTVAPLTGTLRLGTGAQQEEA